MTYLESITYQTGRFLQVSQYALKNAFRVAYLYLGSQNPSPYLKTLEAIEACEAKAKSAVIENQGKGTQELLDFFTDKGFSAKDMKTLRKVLLKRDYLISSFFIDNAAGFAKEDVNAYQNAIDELKEYIEDADKLNVSLTKACDKLYDCFR